MYTKTLKETEMCVCERCFLCFGGMITVKLYHIYFIHLKKIIFYYSLGVDHLISCSLIMQQGSRFKVLLFVTYSIIQDIISSEMYIRTGPLNGQSKKDNNFNET